MFDSSVSVPSVFLGFDFFWEPENNWSGFEIGERERISEFSCLFFFFQISVRCAFCPKKMPCLGISSESESSFSYKSLSSGWKMNDSIMQSHRCFFLDKILFPASFPFPFSVRFCLGLFLITSENFSKRKIFTEWSLWGCVWMYIKLQLVSIYWENKHSILEVLDLNSLCAKTQFSKVFLLHR